MKKRLLATGVEQSIQRAVAQNASRSGGAVVVVVDLVAGDVARQRESAACYPVLFYR